MRTEPRFTIESAAGDDARARAAFGAVAAVMAAIFLVHWPTTASMVETWSRSETYKHCFLVVPAVLWFVWQSRAQLAAAPVAPWWPALIPLAGVSALWLTGELASALAPTQWAVVLMIPVTIATLFGKAWARILAFPMAFLLFSVPFGEALTPMLIDRTADFTVAALRAVGVPVFREGQHFVIPSGRWSVVEACSGIRYLMASVVVGTLYAWMIYRSPLRRVLFIAASVAVPIIANWLRAFLIVMIGHLSGNTLAVGVDHIIYGWVFFGIVIGLMFWLGARWREDIAPEQKAATQAKHSPCENATAASRPSSGAIAAVFAVVVAGPLVAAALLTFADKRPLEPAPVKAAGNWSESVRPVSSWAPRSDGAIRGQAQSFMSNDRTVTVLAAWYRDQKQGHELVTSMNQLAPEKGAATQIASGTARVRFDGEESAVRTATVRFRGQRLRVWHWYWIDDRIETSDTRAKLALAVDRLLGRSDSSAWVTMFVEAESDAEGDKVLAAFAQEMGTSLKAAHSATSAR